MPDLNDITARLLAVFPQATRIVLFGSRARGSAREDSDVDLLIVTPSELRPMQRGVKARLALYGTGLAFDLIVLTPDEYAREKEFAGGVVATAAGEGRVLHEAA